MKRIEHNVDTGETLEIEVTPAELADAAKRAADEAASPEFRRAVIIGRLAAIDLDSIRAMRTKSIAKGQAADDTKLHSLDSEADALRAELAGLGA